MPTSILFECLALDTRIIHLDSLARSDAGLLILGAKELLPEERISLPVLGMYCDDNEYAPKRVIDTIRAQSDMLLAIQISCIGRTGSSCAPWEGGALIAPDRSKSFPPKQDIHHCQHGTEQSENGGETYGHRVIG